MKAQARKLGMQIAVPVALPLRDDKTATYIRAINDNMTSDVQLVVTIVPTGERNTFKKVYIFKIKITPIVRLRVHFSRHCDFNQLSDRSIKLHCFKC